MTWHPWPVERAWPASAEEERHFVVDLTEAAARASAGSEAAGYDRADVTVVVTALRNGARVQQVLDWVVGMDPGSLLRAYRDLDQRRRDALEAWYRISDAPSTTTLAQHGPAAARLVPAAVGRMTRVMRDTAAAGLPLAAAKLQTLMDELTREAAIVERRLADERDDRRARQIGRELFTPHGQCLYNEPLFLAQRVGQLSPQRVANLLADDPDQVGVTSLADLED